MSRRRVFLEYMRQAAAGRANEKILKMVEELCVGSKSGVEQRAFEVIRMGETSGTDTLVGIILGLESALLGGGGRR